MTDGHGPAVPDDGHAGDLVSARLDGELDAATAAWVDMHLHECEPCRGVAGAVEAARSWMRTAPSVDAAPVVESVITRRRRLVGTGLAFVGVAWFALGLLAVTSAVTHPTVTPDIEALISLHDNAGHDQVDGMRAVDHGGAHYSTPVTVGNSAAPMQRRAVFDGRDLTTVVYESDDVAVTLFEQPGRIDWDELPTGTTETIAGRRAWLRPGSPTVVVTEIGDLVVTLVADDPHAVSDIVATLPAPRRTSMVDRVHDSCQELMEVFALGG
ncbi:MAG: anti-sigma factor [Acidimicrobiales bacterium]|nr:anti-sigma factor [Acidimicrobiales bacterium]